MLTKYNITNPVFVDLETTNRGLNGSPEAHYEDNEVLLCGWAVLPSYGEPYVEIEHYGINGLMDYILDTYTNTQQMVTVVAHNAKFDLKYLYKYYPMFDWKKMVTCYCTMYAEYRLSGMTEQFPSLEDSCKKRGIAFKKGLDLGALIKSGIKMEDIPSNDLIPYLKEDVIAVMKLFCHQTQQEGAEYIRHGHIMALADIEMEGMLLDVQKTQREMAALADKRNRAEVKLDALLCKYIDWMSYKDKKGKVHIIPFDPKDVNATAPRTISFLLTGEPSGMITKGVKKTAYLTKPPMLTAAQITDIWGSTTPTHLGYPMDEGSLKKVAAVLQNDFISTLMEFRQCTKLMNTYMGPFLEQATRPNAKNPTVHPKLNYARTATGRLSSSNPNGQNMPEDARALFYSYNGNMAEIDFKQLEIIALAMKSYCPYLRDDIKKGEDIHFNTGKSVFGWKVPTDMNDKDRKSVKAVNFGVLFGGSAYGLSLSTGLLRQLVQQLIDSLYTTYPGVKAWHDRIVREVEKNKKPAGFKNGTQIYTSEWRDSNTGRLFKFRQVKNQRGEWSFKPTQIKNYPVQGYAGGDIVMIALEKLWRALDKAVGRLRMTVHDSILVDWQGTEAVLRNTMTCVCEETKRELGIDLPLQFDISFNKYWS